MQGFPENLKTCQNNASARERQTHKWQRNFLNLLC